MTSTHRNRLLRCHFDLLRPQVPTVLRGAGLPRPGSSILTYPAWFLGTDHLSPLDLPSLGLSLIHPSPRGHTGTRVCTLAPCSQHPVDPHLPLETILPPPPGCFRQPPARPATSTSCVLPESCGAQTCELTLGLKGPACAAGPSPSPAPPTLISARCSGTASYRKRT